MRCITVITNRDYYRDWEVITLNSYCGRWGHDSKNISCPTRVHSSVLWRHISNHQSTTWLYDSFVQRTYTGILFQPCDLGCWISIDLTLQWGNSSFIYHHGHWRWHNRRSWDGFTRIALGSLRALIAYRSKRPLISLWVPLFPLGPWGPRGPGGPCLPWAPGLSLSAPYSSLAVYLTGQATQGQLGFSFDVVTGDYYTCVWFLVFIFWAAFVATVCFCN